MRGKKFNQFIICYITQREKERKKKKEREGMKEGERERKKEKRGKNVKINNLIRKKSFPRL